MRVRGFRNLEVGWKVGFLLVGVLMMGLVLAVTWTGDEVDYHVTEDVNYYHNLGVNISGFNSDITFMIDTQLINWTNASGTFSVSAEDVVSWISITNETTGNLTINATEDWQTGYFVIPIQANNASGPDVVTDFEFCINATNDLPNFSLVSNYSVSVPVAGNTSLNISLVGNDDEEQYPLVYDVSFVECSHAVWSSKSDCNLSYDMVSLSDTTSTLALSNLTNNDVGVYNLTICSSDFFNPTSVPLHRDSFYDENKSYCQNTTLNLLASLSINVTNCTGATIIEGTQFNCTINITTQGASDSLNISSYAILKSTSVYNEANRDWFYGGIIDNAVANSYSIPISITPGKEEVGNWTINFSATDLTTGGSSIEEIDFYVNFTESFVSLSSIGNMTLYEDGSFDVVGSDNDLLIWDDTVKDEFLTFASNTSWVTIGSSVTVSGNDYSTVSVDVNYDYILTDSGMGNYSIRINVTDFVGSFDEEVFVIEILNESGPEWNASLNDLVVFNLTESISFFYNASLQVSDAEGDSISFYYENVSEEFCSLASGTVPTGIISFNPTDCDVGFHNVTIIASDGKMNSSHSFIFNVSNVADPPIIFSFTGENASGQEIIEPGFNFIVTEDVMSNFFLLVDDYDFLIPILQRAVYYNESLGVDMIFTNSTGGIVDLFNFSFVEFAGPSGNSVSYEANFTAGVSEVGVYEAFLNITDASGNSVNRSWNLTVIGNLKSPVLIQIDNVSLTYREVVNFSVNATDSEDDYNGIPLNYSIVAIDSGSPNLTIVNNRIEFNMSSNSSYAGSWRYNVTVNDSDDMKDWQVFYLFVYDEVSLFSPVENSSFSAIENISSILNFTFNHSVGDNLTYEFWMDSVTCPFQDNSNCNYGNLTLRGIENYIGNGSVFGWNFTPNYLDETYGLLKNLTVRVYPNSTALNLSQRESLAVNFSFKLNISHTNAPMRKIGDIGLLQGDYNSNIALDLEGYFEDEDVSDSYWAQDINFTKTGGGADITVVQSSGWNVLIGTTNKTVHTDFISIMGSDNSTSDVIDSIEVSFIAPVVVTTPSSSSRTKIVIKFFSIRIIVPEDVIISDDNYIEIPFALENAGNIDLSGIDLSSHVLYNNEFADDVSIDLGVSYVDGLKAGERKEYSMKILADTNRVGRYKATLFANITSPQFQDWGDFFIDLRKTNESEAEELFIFTEKIIADNPECLELTEIFRRAQEAFEAGNEVEAMKLATEVSEACEDAIRANEQIRYKIDGFVEENLYYISFVTLLIFFIGFVSYIYKRVRFNSSEEEEYIR